MLKALRPFIPPAPVIYFLVLPILSTSCYLAPLPHPNQRAPNGSESDTVVKESVLLDRSVDGSTLSVSFETAYNAHCQISYTVRIDNNPDPAAETLSWKTCTSQQPGRVFKEALTGLDPDARYVVGLRIWPQNKSQDEGVVRFYKEDMTPGDQSAVYVFRSDKQTMSGVAETVKLTEDSNTTLQRLTKVSDCHMTSGDAQTPLGELQVNSVLARLSSKGYLTGATRSTSQTAGAKAFVGSGVQSDAAEWVLNVQTPNSSGSIRPKIPPNFSKVLFKQNQNSFEINSVSLGDENQQSSAVSLQSNAVIEWTLNKSDKDLLAKAVITVSISSESSGKNAFCKFAGNTTSGDVPKDILNQFAGSPAKLLISVETHEFLVNNRWIIRSIDWRSSRLRL